MCTGMGEIGQVCIWELAGLVKLSVKAGRIGQECLCEGLPGYHKKKKCSTFSSDRGQARRAKLKARWIEAVAYSSVNHSDASQP